MVRQMKCPFCGNMVSVSSHWETATCSKCHQNFEITVDVFELTEEEQAKEMEAAKQKIQADEARRDERTKETKKRLRAALHLPEEDPHANVKFEDDEKNDAGDAKEPMDRKKLAILGGLIGVVVLFIVIFALVIGAAMKKANSNKDNAEATPSSTTQTEAVVSDGKATVEDNDGDWVDGYAIDSNNEDGKYMIDLQSSDGEQKEVTLTPDVVDESEKAAPAAEDLTQPAGTGNSSDVEGQRDLSTSDEDAATGSASTSDNIEPANTKPASVPTDEEATNAMLGGSWD